MSAQYLRGGIPRHLNESTAVATVENWTWDGGVANYLWLRNTGTGPLVLFFTAASAAAGDGVTIAAGAVWEGPTEIAGFYTSSAAAEAFESVVFLRRG